MKSSLVVQSKIFKKEADLLLQKSQLLAFLKRYGQVKLTGAYRLNLMLNGDIDIHIINPKINKDLAIEILNELIGQGFFNGYLFYDWVKFRKAEFPKGYYLGLKKKFNRKKWKIDIWFLKNDDHKENDLMDLVERNLNEKNKLTILEFKNLRNKRNLKIPSAKIYQAVIEKDVASFEELA